MLSAGQNMAEIQLQRRSRDTELASLASLARAPGSVSSSHPTARLLGGGNSFFRDSSFVVTKPLSKHLSHPHSLKHSPVMAVYK